MSIEMTANGSNGTVKISECPFCEEEIPDQHSPARHLIDCEPFIEEWADDGIDPDDIEWTVSDDPEAATWFMETESDGTVVIDFSEPSLCWRVSCPNGHVGRSLELLKGAIWCNSCSRSAEYENAFFPAILDRKTDELILREDIEIQR